MAGLSRFSLFKEDSFSNIGPRNTDALKRLNIDKDSWHGDQKEEVSLKVMECIEFLKEWNISSPEHLLVPFIKEFLDKINTFEEGVLLGTKIAQSVNINAAIDANNKSLERNKEYNEGILYSMKLSMLENAMAHISLKSEEEVYLPMRDHPTLSFERITELLDVIEEQQNEINTLLGKKKEFSP